MRQLSKFAPAKINLFLRVTGRRADGYHLLESLVVFADYGDEILVSDDDKLSLEIGGQFAPELHKFTREENLVWKAAVSLQNYVTKTGNRNYGAKITLIKNLPIASGIGGGSADAAATIQVLCELWGVDIPQEDLQEIALGLGSDVPVCLCGKPALMRGIGDEIMEVELTHKSYMVLVNPNIPLATAEIFKDFAQSYVASSDNTETLDKTDIDSIVDGGYCVNDLQNHAVKKLPVIDSIIKSLRDTDKCLVAGMSGSGATCFALYNDRVSADKAVEEIQKIYENAWCVSTRIK